MISYRSLTRWEPGVQLPPGVSEAFQLTIGYAIIWRQLLHLNLVAEGFRFIREHRVPIKPGDFVMVTEPGTVLVLDPLTAGRAVRAQFLFTEQTQRIQALANYLGDAVALANARTAAALAERDNLLRERLQVQRASEGAFRG